MTKVLLVAAILSALSPALIAWADPGCAGSIFDRQGCVEATDGSLTIGNETRQRPELASASTRRLESYDAEIQAAFCADATDNAIAGGGAPQAVVEICRGFVGVAGPVAPTREDVRRAFRELPLYRGAIRTDPSAFTLVNLETYFWCGDSAGRGCDVVGEGERTVTLLGQQVRIRPRIIAYTWDFGDGAGQQGARATHTYRHAVPATIALTLTWTADYALPGGAFQPIDDTTTTTSPPRILPVREAQAVIVR
jgi:hypothetical protein